MKTMLRIGLIVIGVLTIWVAHFAKERGQSLTKAPEPSVDLQSLTKALSGEWSLNVKFEAGLSMPKGLSTPERTLGERVRADRHSSYKKVIRFATTAPDE